MPHVVDDAGRDLGVITDPGLLSHYTREVGFTIDGVLIAGPPSPAQTGPVSPAHADLKSAWIDFAHEVDAENAAEIDEMTKDELIAKYGV